MLVACNKEILVLHNILFSVPFTVISDTEEWYQGLQYTDYMCFPLSIRSLLYYWHGSTRGSHAAGPAVHATEPVIAEFCKLEMRQVQSSIIRHQWLAVWIKVLCSSSNLNSKYLYTVKLYDFRIKFMILIMLDVLW